MKRRKSLNSQAWLTGATASLVVISSEQSTHASHQPLSSGMNERLALPLNRFAFYREGILGTSFELQVGAIHADDARVCEQQVLSEIERLRCLLSTYDPESEINRVRAGARVNSPDLAALLAAYNLWTQRTDGGIQVNLAGVVRLWKEACDLPPSKEALAVAFNQPCAYNVDALGKGYIIDRAVEVARRFATSGLLNIGGDIRVWGGTAWQIGIADPFAPEENAPLLGRLSLRDGAVATSGGYSRFVTLAGRQYSHIIDPRTLQPATDVCSATIAAPDCLTANALSTAANVLGLDSAVRLVKLFGAWQHFLVDSQGRVESSLTPTAVVIDTPQSQTTDKKPAVETPVASDTKPTWPTNFQVKVTLNLKTPAGGRAKRPYVAIWVEDSNKKIVRTVTVLGSNWKWLRELNTWWQAADKYTDEFTQSVTRATRAPGNYVFTWDGLDDKKQPVPQGEYKIFIEVNREHGSHATEFTTIKCGAGEQSSEIHATSESEVSKVAYGPKTP